MKKTETEQWYKLDNAAKIYPSVKNGRWNAVYRCSAVLKTRVDRDILQSALEDIVKRYPSINVTIKKGFFWYYLQESNEAPIVKQEDNYPCSKFDLNKRGLLYRVLYNKFRISVEFFHSLTDGYGGINFLNTLLLRYFHILGKKIETENLLHYDDSPEVEEVEDSYMRYTNLDFGKIARRETPAYHLSGPLEIEGVLRVVHGEVETSKILALAKEAGVSLNQYIVAVMAYVCYKRKHYENKSKKQIKIQNAINLRSVLPSKTLRNFSAVVNIPLDESKPEMTFEDILANTVNNTKMLATRENFIKFINANCSIEKNIFVRLVPLFIKSFGMKIAFYRVGENLFTTTVSNMGRVAAPKEFEKYVDRYEFVLGAQKYNNNSLTVGSFNNKTVFTFSRIIKNATLERDFFRFLSDKGLEVFINSNDIKS